MINFILIALSDTQREVQDLARKFARDEIIPVAAELDRTGEYPWDILKKAHKLGLLNSNIPTKYGNRTFVIFYILFTT